MSNRKRPVWLTVGGFISFISLFWIHSFLFRINAAALQSQPTPTPGYTIYPQGAALEEIVTSLEARINSIEGLVEVQSNVFNATVSRMESNLNLLLAIVALVSFIVALLGFGVVRLWIRQLIENQLKNATSEEIMRVAEEERERIRKEWDPRFAELYDEYRRTVRKE